MYTRLSNSLRKDRSEILELIKKEKDPIIRDELYRRLSIIELSIAETECVNQNKRPYIDDLVNGYINYESVYPYILRYTRLKKTASVDFNPRFVYIPDEEKIDLIRGFFETTDKEIYDIFMRLISREDHLKIIDEPLNIQGRTLLSFDKDGPKPYLEVEEQGPTNYQYTMDLMSHEYGHGIEFYFNGGHTNKQYVEISSYFFQLCSDYYLSREMNDPHFLLQIKKGFDSNQLAAKDIVVKRRQAIKYLEKGSPSKEEVKEGNTGFGPEIFYNKVSGYDDDIVYAFSFLVAVELFEIYKQDPKEAIRILKKIMSSNVYDEFGTIIEHVEPGKSLALSRKKINEKIKKSLTNQ